MLVLGIQGSPRKNGNTDYLLGKFMEEFRLQGSSVNTINVCKKNIKPCVEYKLCETKGFCPIDDDMKYEIYPLLWMADIIVIATPVFFYGVPAQLKAFIDRSQTQWARKHILKLEDPGRKWRKGFLLALGATKGENLFEGIKLTVKYFFDAIGADFAGNLSYRKIENPGDIQKHPDALKDVKEKSGELIKHFLNRKKVLFACKGNACRSQMAQAFAQYSAGDRIEAMSGGDTPAENVDGIMTQAMAEIGIDMAFRKPRSIAEVINNNKPDIVVSMGCDVACPVVPGAKRIEWDLPDPRGKSIEFIRDLRDTIEKKISDLINTQID